MKVNPVYATTAEANVQRCGVRRTRCPTRSRRPTPTASRAGPAGSRHAAAAVQHRLDAVHPVLPRRRPAWPGSADDRAKINRNPFAVVLRAVLDPSRAPGPRTTGDAHRSPTRVSAAKYGHPDGASLSRAGDNGDDRAFVAPDASGLTAGVGGHDRGRRAHRPRAGPDGRRATAATRCTTLSYAMVRPLTLDADGPRRLRRLRRLRRRAPVRSSGLEPGQLPRGYATSPGDLVDQARSAATAIREMQAPAPGAAASRPGPRRPEQWARARRQHSGLDDHPDDADHRAGRGSRGGLRGGGVAPTDAGPLTPILALARSRYFLLVLAALACRGDAGRARDHQAPAAGRRRPTGQRTREPVMSTALARSLVVSRIEGRFSSRSWP